MSTNGQDLLYREATGAERSMANVDVDRIMEVDAELIIDTWDPERCPLRLLPYLAWAMGVEFWNQNWSETTQRQWVAQQWQYKALRGTKAGAAMALDYAGRDVTPFGYRLVSVVAQPQKIFSGPGLSVEEREAWLSNLPQVRVYYYVDQPVAYAKKLFAGGTLTSRHCFFEGMFPTPSEGTLHLQRRATYNVGGVDTDVTVTDFGSYYQVHLNGVEGNRVFCGRPSNNGHHYQPSTAKSRLLTVQPNYAATWRVPVTPSLVTVNAKPDLVAQTGTQGYAVFSGTGLQHWSGNLLGNGHFFLPSTAKYRLFDRYAVNDGSTYGGGGRPNVQFMGVGRYGWPEFTAQINASIPGKRSEFAAGDGVLVPQRRFWIPHDPKPMNYVREALESSRRLIDKMLLRAMPAVSFIAGEPFIAGEDHYVVGSPTPSTN